MFQVSLGTSLAIPQPDHASPPQERKAVAALTDHICYICLKRVQDLGSAHIDHKNSLAGGGDRTSIRNLRIAHPKCNLKKGKDSVAVGRRRLRDEGMTIANRSAAKKPKKTTAKPKKKDPLADFFNW